MNIGFPSYARGILPVVKTAEQFQSLAKPLVHTPTDTTVCRLWLTRHGQSQANATKVNIGSGESPLTEDGRKQAREAGRLLAKHVSTFSQVVCSSLQRTQQSAEEISTVMPLPRPFRIEKAIGERFCGALLQGDGVTEAFYRPFKDREAEDISKLASFDEKFEYKMRHENGAVVCDQESLAEVYLRGVPALVQVAQDNLGKDVLVSTHIGFMRAMIIGLASQGATQNSDKLALEVRSFELPNGAAIAIASDGKKMWLEAAHGFKFLGK